MTLYLIAGVCFLIANGITITARSSNGEHTESLPHTIQCLTEKISEYQAKKDTRFFPPNYWSKTKGIYESDVKLYFHGKPVMTLVRHLFSIYDINMFATTWINYVLLEAHKFGKAPKPSPTEIDLSLDAIAKFTNKNLNYTNSVMTFWPQSYNDTEKVWQSAPQNLLSFFKVIDYMPLKLIEIAIKLLGLDELEKNTKQLLSQKDFYQKACHIPPDFDDTFVNLALGSILTDMKSSFPKQHSTWLGHNSNITGIFDFLKRYAYRPFSKDRAVNSIDPRSYFYLRSFLADAAKNGKDVALVPTWIQNIDEARQMQNKGVMPLNVNNIGCTVSANVIFGITSSILTGLLPPTILDDPEVEKIYRNTSSMLTWQLHTEFSKRPDLGLMYYPSLIEFYWFVSRTSSALERYAISGHLPHKALEDMRQQFGKVLRGHVTEHILSLATKDGSQLYFDDFLGDADISLFNKTTVKAEDRLFTTAAAVNALQGIWTLYNDTTKQNNWINGTPQNVIDIVMLSVSFLQKNILGHRYKPWNAFFSTSIKGLSTSPFLYPINRYVNNTHNGYYLLAMEGIISEEEYLKETKISRSYFGKMTTTPMEFHGFNSDSGVFPYWNSVPYTYATTLLALSRFQNTVLI